MSDIIEILRPRKQYPAVGIFFQTRPLNHNSGGVKFAFAYVEPRSKNFARIFANVIAEDGEIAISTNAKLNIKAGESVIRTPDGQLYLVNQSLINFDKIPQQALRIFKTPCGVEQIIRMTPISDPAND